MIKGPILDLPISKKNAYVLRKIKKGERIPLVSDIMFHTMLNNESRKKYVSYLLSLIMEKDFRMIEENIKFVKNKLDKKTFYESSQTVDLVCLVDGEIYNIEMNNNTSISALERNIAYLSDLYKSKMTTGKKYEYQKTIQININNFSFQGDNHTLEIFKLRDENGCLLTDKITIIYIYLPKIREKYYNEDKLTELERLLLVFNESDSKKLNDIIKGDLIMNEYQNDALEASQDEEIIGLYDRKLHLEMLHNTELYEAEQRGIKEEKITIARELLKNGISKEIIKKATGLTKEEIDQLN